MTIDEAIAKHIKIAKTQKALYDACTLKERNKHFLREAEEHEQLAEWLQLVENGYNKALNDFVNFAKTMPTVEEEDGTIRPMWLEEMGEQLKADVKNE